MFAALLAVSPAPEALAQSEDVRFFRIGTGGTGGTYYPIGALVASAISENGDVAACPPDEFCGIPGLVAVPQTSNGSVANINDILGQRLESGFAQSDVIEMALSGQREFAGRPPIERLRSIANLYVETLHIVARRDSGIGVVADLAGKRVSLDEPGSGTLVDARIVLAAHGLSEADLKPEYIKPGLAIERMQQGHLDAFFIVAGHPVQSIAELAETATITLIPIDEGRADKIVREWGFLTRDVVPADAYANIGETPTLGVGAQWIVDADVDEGLIYEVTRALWSDRARRILDGGHPKARTIVLERALDGLAAPLHPGAARYYREIGLLE